MVTSAPLLRNTSRALALVGMLLVWVLCAEAAASPSSIVKRAEKVSKRGITFDLSDIDGSTVSAATLRNGQAKRRLAIAPVKRAIVRGGLLRTRVPKTWSLDRVKSGARPGKSQGKPRLIVSVDPEAATSEPAPPAPPAQGPGGAVSSETNAATIPAPSPAPDPVPSPVPNPAPTPAPAAANLRVGLVSNAQGWNMNSQQILDLSIPTGVGWMREEFQWSVIEPTDDNWNFARYDHLLLEAAARNVRILPLLIETPSWAGAAWNTIPSDPAEFAEYTAKVVGRYGPGGSFWAAHPEVASFAPEYFELWNEPYLSAFSAGGVNAGRYARLVKAAASAGRAANPQAKYLLAAEQTPAGDARHTFIDDMYAAVPDLNDYFDAVAAHPYSGSSAPDDPRGGWGFPRLGDIRQKFVDHGASDKKIWLTEIGWSTCPQSPDYCTSEQQQAAYLAQMFDLLAGKYSSYVEAAFIYHRTDLNSNPTDKEGWFGLERLDGSRKPAYAVLQAAAGA